MPRSSSVFSALALLLATGLLLSGCDTGEFQPGAAIPADVTTYGRIDLRHLLDEGQETWAREALESLESNEDYLRLRDEVGLDPLRDVDEIYLGVGEEPDLGQAVAVLRGRFDPARVIEGLQLQEGYSTETLGGTTVHYLQDSDGKRSGFFFPAEGWAVAVGELWAPAALDSLEGRRPDVTSNEEIQSLVDHVDRNDPIWVVAKVPPDGLPGGTNPMLASMLNDIRAVMASADMDPEAGLHLLAMVRTGRPATAANLQSMLNGFLQMGRVMVAEQSPALAELLGQMQLTSEGDVARLELRCDPALLDRVRADAEKLAASNTLPGLGGTDGEEDEHVPFADEEDPFADDPFFQDDQEDSPSGQRERAP